MTLAIVQARMGSQRLPGKVMRKIENRPTIDYLLERLEQANCIDKTVVAIPDNKDNDILYQYLQARGCEVFRGDEEDVLARYYYAALKYNPKAIVRITADCPLLDPKVIDEVIQFYLENNFDYVSNIHPRTYPDGLDIEIFSFAALKKTWEVATLPEEREHVTPFIVNSGKFMMGNVACDQSLGEERWTLDTEDDFKLISFIFKQFQHSRSCFLMDDILALRNRHPEIFQVNKGFL